MPPATEQLTLRQIEEEFYRLAETRQQQIQRRETDVPSNFCTLDMDRLRDLISQLAYRPDVLALAVPSAERSFSGITKRFWKKLFATALRWLLIRQVEFNTLAFQQAKETASLLDAAAQNLEEVLAAMKVQSCIIQTLSQRVLRLEMEKRGARWASSNVEAPARQGPRAPTLLADLVEVLRPYTRIVVTGPQRSGTTIAARILAHELGYEFLPEESFGIDNLHEFFRLYDRKDRFVVQAPCLCSSAHFLPGCVVLVRRDIDEIIRSQERINWVFEPLELQNYFKNAGPIARVRYEAWDRFQKPRMAHAFEVAYESLRSHPLWIEAERRAGFHARQTALQPASD